MELKPLEFSCSRFTLGSLLGVVLPLLFLAFIILVLYLSIAYPERGKGGSPIVAIPIIFLVVAPLLLLMSYEALKGLFTSKNTIIANHEGLTVNYSVYNYGLIKWENITEIEKMKSHGRYNVIAIRTNKPVEYYLKLPEIIQLQKSIRLYIKTESKSILLKPYRFMLRVFFRNTEFKGKGMDTEIFEKHGTFILIYDMGWGLSLNQLNDKLNYYLKVYSKVDVKNS